MKTCVGCSLDKPLHEFYRKVTSTDGRTDKCRHCLDRDAMERYIDYIEKDKLRREKKKK